jgi:CheY-like chemotaxis protein
MDLRAKRDERSPESKPIGLASGVGVRPSVDTTVAKSGALPRARILVVEDQDDVRRHLECITYDLVLSDYAMPGGTGAWMLQEAKRRGLIRDVAAVIVTAYAEIRELPGISVVHKPLDLDAFLDQVRRLIFPPQHRERDPRAVHQKLELVLYVSSRSRASAEALRNLQSFLAHVDPAHVKCDVVDLEERPQAGDADRITFTPTLVKHHPGPRTWIIGTLRDPCIFENLLQAAGINGRR